MRRSKEQVAASLTEVLFSKLNSRFFDKYTDYEMQSDFLKTEILKVYYGFLEELKNPPKPKKR